MFQILNNYVLDMLYDQLKRLGFEKGTEHPLFHDWEKLLESKFVSNLFYRNLIFCLDKRRIFSKEKRRNG